MHIRLVSWLLSLLAVTVTAMKSPTCFMMCLLVLRHCTAVVVCVFPTISTSKCFPNSTYSAPWHNSFTVFTEIWINNFVVASLSCCQSEYVVWNLQSLLRSCTVAFLRYFVIIFGCFVRTNHLLSKRIFRSVSFLTVSSLASSSEWRRSKERTKYTHEKFFFHHRHAAFYSCFVGIVQVHRSYTKTNDERRKKTIQNDLEFSVGVCECVENKRKYVKKWLFVGRSTVIQNTGISVGCCNRPTDAARLTSQLSSTHIDTHTGTRVCAGDVSACSLCASRGQNGNEQKYVIITRSRRKKRQWNGSRKMS